MKPILPNNCEVGCKHYTGGEMKHTQGCINYPDSLSRQFDENETRIQQLEAELLASRNFAIEIDKEHTKTIESLNRGIEILKQNLVVRTNVYHDAEEALKEELKKRDEEIERISNKVTMALEFIKEKRKNTPGLGALEMILGKYEEKIKS